MIQDNSTESKCIQTLLDCEQVILIVRVAELVGDGVVLGELVADVVKVVVGEAQHLVDSAEEQDVTVLLHLQLLAVVLHRKHTGQRHTQTLAHLLGLQQFTI